MRGRPRARGRATPRSARRSRRDRNSRAERSSRASIDGPLALPLQREVKAGRGMLLARRTSPALPQHEHRVTFRAEAIWGLRSGEIVRKHKIQSLRLMPGAARTDALVVGVAIEEQRIALVAEPPAALHARAFGDIEIQLHARGAARVGATRGAMALVG